jgi:thiaminase/transcriptional activator TenA
MKFMECLVKNQKAIWLQCANTSFFDEMGNGSLSKEKYRKYIVQDSLYLRGYLKEFAYAIIKAKTMKEMQMFYNLLGFVNEGENTTRLAYLKDFGLTDEDIDNMEPGKQCQTYLNFLNKTTFEGDIDSILMASFPCMIGYYYIFSIVKEKYPRLMTGYYAMLIADYTSDEYRMFCEEWIEYVSERCVKLTVARKQELESIFIEACKQELLFFQALDINCKTYEV